MTELLTLQHQQQEHDREYHRDIYTLPYPDRMNHYILHFSKYVGRLSQDYPDDDMRGQQLEKTIADCFIVALATANTLNLNLQNELEEMFGLEEDNIDDWADMLNTSDEMMKLEELQDWLFKQLATPAGNMANAMESLDHMESVDARQIWEEETIDIVANLMIASESLNPDLEKLLEERWTEIEEQSIL